MSTGALRYHYDFDPSGDGTAARVCRLAAAGHRVLELGCAAGAMSAVLSRHYGCEVTGVEYDAAAGALAREHCAEVLQANLDLPDWSAPLAGRRFDTVLAADVLEHLRDPRQCLARILPLLEADGQLVISVPNISHAGVIASLLCDDFAYRDTGLLDRTHIHFFTAHTLGKALADAGFVVESFDSVDTGPWHPEFAEYWSRLPEAVREWLAQNPAGRAFQILVTARPARPAEPASDVLNPRHEAQQHWLAQPLTARDDAATAQLRQALADAEAQRDDALAARQAIEQSTLWRMTSPLRRLLSLLRARS